MPRRRAERYVVSGTLVTCLVLAACASAPAVHLAGSSPGLPANARIVKALEVQLPVVPQPSSSLPGVDQRSVFFIDSRTGFLATGGEEIATNQGGVYNPASGGIQRTTDGGKTWQSVWTAPGADISSVHFLSGSVGFAAGRILPTATDTGAQGEPVWLRTSNGGTSWTAETPQLPTSGSDAWPLFHFVAATPRLLLAAPNPNDQAGGFGSVMLRSSDGGSHWSQVGPSGWTASGGIAFASPSIAFATGFMMPSGASTAGPRLWTSHDAGLTWKAVPGTDVPFSLLAIDFPDAIHGYAAGGNLAKYEMRPSRALLATSDGGRTWAMRYESPDADVSNPISTLHFLDATHGWASIGSCSEGQNGPCGGPVMLTTDGGRSWRMTSRSAFELGAVGPNEAWIVDGRGPVGAFAWHSTDAGLSWTSVVRAAALAINSLAGSHGWLVASTAAGSWQSTDNGASWSAFDRPMLAALEQVGGTSLVAQPPGLLVVNDSTGLQISHDAGARVFDVTLPGQDLNGTAQIAASFSDGSHGMAIVGAQNCVKAPGYTRSDSGKPPAGVPSGVGTVAVTSDGGTTWTTRASLDVLPWGAAAAAGLWAVAGSTACAPPRQVLMISRDDGRHWITQGLPLSCFEIGVAAPQTIWLGCLDSVPGSGNLLITQDGAMTWTQYRFPAGLPSFLLTGPEEAWAYGPAGALWHTMNGGRSWRAAPVPF